MDETFNTRAIEEYLKTVLPVFRPLTLVNAPKPRQVRSRYSI